MEAGPSQKNEQAAYQQGYAAGAQSSGNVH